MQLLHSPSNIKKLKSESYMPFANHLYYTAIVNEQISNIYLDVFLNKSVGTTNSLQVEGQLKQKQ